MTGLNIPTVIDVRLVALTFSERVEPARPRH